MSAPGLDTRILLALNWCARTRSAGFFQFLSEYGLYAFGLVGLAAFVRSRTRAEGGAGRALLLAWFSAGLVAESWVKPLCNMKRPTGYPLLRPQLFVLGTAPGPKSLGMPSGTAAMCFAAALCVWLYWGRRAGAVAMATAALVSASRVVAGVHWPSDVTAGALVGLATAALCHRLDARVGASST